MKPEQPMQYELVECEFKFCLGLIPNVCPDAQHSVLPANYFARWVDLGKPKEIYRIGRVMATVITEKYAGVIIKKETSNPDVEALQSHVSRKFAENLSVSHSLSTAAKKNRKRPEVTADEIRAFMDKFEKEKRGKRGAIKAAQLEFGFKDVRTLKNRLKRKTT